MKAIMLMFDTLNRHMLPPYGCDWTIAPNFKRLAEKTVVFDNCYIGSMPCIPARRELHTGRYNFLHRCWGPLEPFDDSMPELLKKNGIYTHLITDHMHYFEDGGCTYHTRYKTWEFIRGRVGDPWKGEVKDPKIPECISTRNSENQYQWRQEWINRKYIKKEEDHPLVKVFENSFEFIRKNNNEDNWFLQIENFSPHEPFFSSDKYKELYKHKYDGPLFDWPDYTEVKETSEQIEHVRLEYAALLTMCDTYLGKLLDIMDELDMWKDTMLIVNTDHGLLLGEHNRWGKRVCTNYEEIAHIPLFIWDPRSKKAGERRKSLVQTIDLAPTLLEYFGIDIPKDMEGRPLRFTIDNDQAIRNSALFGVFGGHINCTDGRYIYMRAPVNNKNDILYNYTLMPTYMINRFSPDELRNCELVDQFSFTKGCKILKTRAKKAPKKPFLSYEKYTNMLFDIQSDPNQESPIINNDIEDRMIKLMIELMQKNDAPIEQYERVGLQEYIK